MTGLKEKERRARRKSAVKGGEKGKDEFSYQIICELADDLLMSNKDNINESWHDVPSSDSETLSNNLRLLHRHLIQARHKRELQTPISREAYEARKR